MPKKRDPNSQRPLSHYWMPWRPGKAFDGMTAGEPISCMATTFKFDAGFFESDLLPRFLGLKFDQAESEPTFIIEREEALANARAIVLVDASQVNKAQTTLRWDQVPVRVPGGLLHSKVAVLHWDRFVRVIVGSANLTRSGYRRNREVFAALDFWDDDSSVPRSVLYDVLDLLRTALEWSCAAPAVRARAEETLDTIRRAVRRWGNVPAGFGPRERPRVTLAVTRPRMNGSGARSALADVINCWGARRAASVAVVTPFVAQHLGSDQRDVVVEKLLQVPRTRDCRGDLVVPEHPRDADDDLIRVPLPEAFGRAWERAFSPECAFVLPIPQCVDRKERDLHSKALLLENDADVLLMVGSSNFSPHGMGIGAYNLEANLVFFDSAPKKHDGLTLSDRLDLPLDWSAAREVAEVCWQAPELLAEDVPDDAAAPPPAFFAWATYSQATGELRLQLDRGKQEPAAWSIALSGNSEQASQVLFASGQVLGSPAPSMLSYTLPAEARGVNVVVLSVKWTEAGGAARQGTLAVCAESEGSFLPPSEFRRLSADAIIECLISGKSPSQWYDRNQRQRADGAQATANAAVESLRAVDTSGYLLYRVRRFGRALAALRERVGGAPPRAIGYRLLKDPFGPVSLAERLMEAAEDASPGVNSQLDAQHRVFLVAEILLTVGMLREQLSKATRGNDRKRIEEQFEAAQGKLTEFRKKLCRRAGFTLPENLAGYVREVQKRIDPNSAWEATDAG